MTLAQIIHPWIKLKWIKIRSRNKKIIRKSKGLDLYYGGESEFFDYDKVVIAAHADEALKLIDNPTNEETKILSNFSYKENIAYIHTDKRAMPKNKKAWSSWNSSIKKNEIE